MLSFMISRPCRELARPAASICPKGEPARSSLSLPASSSRACTQRQAWPSKCGGLTREARNVHKRSATIATAITEQAIIGSMIQPPDLISSHTARSEEHTSELQSRPHLVCRLLLEKKKHTTNQHLHIT